jgi:hypothetical protein
VKPASILNGDVGYHVDDPLLAVYTCHSGYTLKGKARRTCNSSGEWEGNLPSCDLGIILEDTIHIFND